MRVAILGAGFAGLAVTWYLLHYTQGSVTVDLFDPEPIGGGPSGISSGLLHAFAGKQAKKSWEADRCLKETHRLLTEASRALSQPLVIAKGILRPALTTQQIHDFQRCAQIYPETEWWEAKRCLDLIPQLSLPENGGALYIKNGLTLDVPSYMQGLWQACALLGTQFHQQALVRNQDLEAYDRILIAMGPLTRNFPPLKDLKIQAVKGQMLELAWPKDIRPPPMSLISQKYLVMSPDQTRCLVGATFEHHFDSPYPNQSLAEQEIMPQILQFYPALKDAQVLQCRAAFRASSYNHLPLIGQVSEKFYFFTGLGSKGLLYHAWVGKMVARAIISGSKKHFPTELYCELS